MIRKKLRAVSDWLDDGLRSLLGRISPDGRIVITLAMLFLFSGASIYLSVSSIYNMGKKKGRQMQIEHIRQVEIAPEQTTDSLNPKNKFNYE